MRPPIKSNTYAIGRSIEDYSCPQYVRKRVVGWRYRKAVRARCERLFTVGREEKQSWQNRKMNENVELIDDFFAEYPPAPAGQKRSTRKKRMK